LSLTLEEVHARFELKGNYEAPALPSRQRNAFEILSNDRTFETAREGISSRGFTSSIERMEFGDTLIPRVVYRPVPIRIMKSPGFNVQQQRLVIQDYLQSDEISLVTFADESPLNSTTTLMIACNLGSQNAIGKSVLTAETMKFVRMKEMIPNNTEGILVMVNMGSYTEELKPLIGKVVSTDELLDELPAATAAGVKDGGKPNKTGKKMELSDFVVGSRAFFVYSQERRSSPIGPLLEGTGYFVNQGPRTDDRYS
jgi:hypothetical protein